MIRTALVIFAGLMLAALPAFAQGGSPESEDSRYTFNRADDGYLRLDGRTGQVSLCTRRPVGWACQAVPDERTALEAEIARLQGENVTLKKELVAHNLPLPGTVKPDQPAERAQFAKKVPEGWKPPLQLHVGDEAGDEDEVERAVPGDLIGDMHVAAQRVPRLRPHGNILA